LPLDVEGKAEYAMNFYRLELITHFRLEDELIFPFLALRETFLEECITNAILEHQQLRLLFLLLERGEYLEHNENKLGEILEKHIRDEEMKLFDKAQDIVMESELIEFQQKILEFRKFNFLKK
jgi:hypothetical protein